MNEEKTERDPAGISFTFGDDGIKQELNAATGKDMLTAAAILIVQVASFEADSDVEKVTEIFLKGYLPEAINQMNYIPKEDKEEDDDLSTAEEKLPTEQMLQRLRDQGIDAQLAEGELKKEAEDECDTEN